MSWSGSTYPFGGLVPSPQGYFGNAYFEGAPWFDIIASGAVGDGVTDDAPAIQRAITAALAVGGTVFIPKAPVKYRLGSSLSVQNGTNIQIIGEGYSSFLAPDAGVGFAMLCNNNHNPLLANFRIEHPLTEHTDMSIQAQHNYLFLTRNLFINYSQEAYSLGIAGTPNGQTIDIQGGFCLAHYRGRVIAINDGNSGGFIGNFFECVTESPAAVNLTSGVSIGATVLPMASVKTTGYGVPKNGDILWIQDASRTKYELVTIQSISGLNITISPGTQFAHNSGTPVALCAQPTNAALQFPYANTGGKIDTLGINGFYTQGFYNGVRAHIGPTSLGVAPLYWRDMVCDGNVGEGLLINCEPGGGGIGGFSGEQLWFTSETADDVLITGTGGVNDITFSDCDFPQAQKSGYHCSNPNAYRITLSDVRCSGGSNAGVNLYSGFQMDANTGWHRFITCYSDPANFARQKYGIRFEAGCIRNVVQGGEYTGNVTAAISFADTMATFAGNQNVIRNVNGYNPYGPLTAPSVPATTVALKNPFPFDVTVYVTSGTGGVTIDVGGVIAASATIATTASAGIVIPVRLCAAGPSVSPGNTALNDSIKLTYSNAPTWTFVAD